LNYQPNPASPANTDARQGLEIMWDNTKSGGGWEVRNAKIKNLRLRAM